MGIASSLTAVGAMLGAASAGVTVYEKVLRRARLLIEQKFSWIEACGSDALVYQMDMRLRAKHHDVYLHDIYFVYRPGWWDSRSRILPDPGMISRLDVARLYPRFDERLAYDLDPAEFADRVALAGEGIPTRDLKVQAGSVLTVTIADVVRQPLAAQNASRYSWWLVIDYGVGRAEEKAFHDM